MRLGELSEASADEGELNVTPLIDVVFILLIFFVVTSTFTRELGLEVERPQASAASEQPSEIVRVAVSDQGQVTVDGRATSPWRVEAEVRDRLRGLARPSVLLVADKHVEAQAMVTVMDACRRAGADNVAVAVDPSPGGGS